MYPQEHQPLASHCPGPAGTVGSASGPGAVLGDFFPDVERSQSRGGHVIKNTPRTRPRSSRRSEAEARYGWCPISYQNQGRPAGGSTPQPMLMPPRPSGGGQQQVVRPRVMEGNPLMPWQDHMGMANMPHPSQQQPPPPPPPPSRPSVYPTAERPYEYCTQPPPPSSMTGGEVYPGLHPPGPHMQQPPQPPPTYQQHGPPPYDYHGAPDCGWRQMPACHSSSRPPYPGQYPSQSQQGRQYYHPPGYTQSRPANVAYQPQYPTAAESPAGWPMQGRYPGQSHPPQVMPLPPMSTPPPSHYYMMERPPSRPPMPVYEGPIEKEVIAPPSQSPYYNGSGHRSMQVSAQLQQQQRMYGQHVGGRYIQPPGPMETPSKITGQLGLKQHQDYQKPSTISLRHDVGPVMQHQQTPNKQCVPYGSNTEKIVTSETNSTVQHYPYYYRYSETVKTSQPMPEHCDLTTMGQTMTNHQPRNDHAISRQAKPTIISSKSVSEVQMLVGGPVGDPRMPPDVHVDHPLEASQNIRQRLEITPLKLTVRACQGTMPGTPQSAAAQDASRSLPVGSQLARREGCKTSRRKSAAAILRCPNQGCTRSLLRGGCKRRLSDSSEVSVSTERDKQGIQSGDVNIEQNVTFEIAKPVPKLDLDKLAYCDEDNSDFDDVADVDVQSQGVSTPKVVSSGDAFLEAINNEMKHSMTKLDKAKLKEERYDPFHPGSATSFEYSIDAENLVAKLCYSSPETSPPSSANREAKDRGEIFEDRSLVQPLSNRSTIVGPHSNTDLLNVESYRREPIMMITSACQTHGNSARSVQMCDNNVALSNSLTDNTEALWKDGFSLVLKGLSFMKSCKTIDKEVVKLIDSLVYDLERLNLKRRSLSSPQHNFMCLDESSVGHQYPSNLSYNDQLNKAEMTPGERTEGMFENMSPRPKCTQPCSSRDIFTERISESNSSGRSAGYTSLAERKVSMERLGHGQNNMQWRQLNGNQLTEEVEANLVNNAQTVVNNTEGMTWLQMKGKQYPYCDQGLSTAPQITDKTSENRGQSSASSLYQGFPVSKNPFVPNRNSWGEKLWRDYIMGNNLEDIFKTNFFFNENNLDGLAQEEIDFNALRQQELDLINGGNDLQNLYQSCGSSSTSARDLASYTTRRSSNYEHDINYLQSAAMKVAPVNNGGKKSEGGNATPLSSSIVKVKRGRTSFSLDLDGLNLSALADTESDDNVSFYMKPGNYLVPRKPASARLQSTEKKTVVRSKRKSFSAPAKTSIFIPYPLDPVVPPLPQTPVSLYCNKDGSTSQDTGRLSNGGVNDSVGHHLASPFLKSKEVKKIYSPVATKERKKKENPRNHYQKIAPKEVTQFQILKRVSKVLGKSDTLPSYGENSANNSSMNSLQQNKINKCIGDVSQRDVSGTSEDGKEFDQKNSALYESKSSGFFDPNDPIGQPRNRNNAAMKSILNFKVKSKPCDKSSKSEDELISHHSKDFDSITSEKHESKKSNSFPNHTEDTNCEGFKEASSCQIHVGEKGLLGLHGVTGRNNELCPSVCMEFTSSTAVINRKERFVFSNVDNATNVNSTYQSHPGEVVAPSGSPPEKSQSLEGVLRGLGSASPASFKGSRSPKTYHLLKGGISAPNIPSDRRASSTPSRGTKVIARSQLSRNAGGGGDETSPVGRHPAVAGLVPPQRTRLLTNGSDDSSSTASANSRHRRGPTPAALGKFEKILKELWNMSESQFVKYNVRSNQLREYYQIVKYPIFLENIENKLRHRYYLTIEDIVHDFRQVFFNSRLYFKESPIVLKKTETLDAKLNELLAAYFPGWDFRQISGDPAERLRNRR